MRRMIRMSAALAVTLAAFSLAAETVYRFDRPVKGWQKEYAGEGFSLDKWWMGPEVKGEVGWATESLPLGNGWFGVSVFGWVGHERLQVTHKALHVDPVWPDASMRGKPTLTNTEELETLPKLTDALELRLDFPHVFEKVTDYRRSLSLDEAVAEVAYTADGVRHTRTYFTSYPDKVLVARLTTDRPGALTFGVRAVNPYPMAQRTGRVTSSGDGIAAEQHFAAFNCDFAARVRVKTDAAGRVTAKDDGTLAVAGATEATLVLACDTNWTFDPEIFKTGLAKTDPRLKDRVAATAETAMRKGFAALAKTHREDYRALYDRVELNLPKDDPTAVAAERAFNFGRYLLIASSRPGTLPANLQGTWNALPQAPWAGGVWCNINVQMNYWPAFPCNLAECFEPYVHFLETLQPAAHAAALQYLEKYPTHRRLPAPEAGLWNLGTGVIPWRTAIPGGHSGPGTGGLTTKLLWDSWDFTRDPAALARAYPLLRGLADFDTRAVDLTNGVYLSIFSASPEQRRVNFLSGESPSGADGCYTTVGCAFDQQMIYENDRDFLRAHRLLGRPEDALTRVVREHLDRLDPVQIGADGQLKEFREENHYGEIGEKDHRHISHLCGLVPGEQINRRKTPEWAAAAERSLDLRGISGGWAAAHRVHCYARLGRGEKAYAHLKHYLENDVAPNGFHSHTLSDVPVFQIDANLGIAAAIAEMLAQGDGEGGVDFLPALPAAWRKEGSFRGLVVRGGKVVNCSWKDGRIVKRSVLAIECPEPNGWTFTTSVRESEPGVQVVTIRAKAAAPSRPPKFSAVVSFPQIDVTGVWNPNFGTAGEMAPLPWWGSVFSVARTQPLRCWFGPNDRNRMMLAAAELRREVKLESSLREEDFCYYTKLAYFTETTEPMSSYETEIRLDARDVGFATAVRDAAAWQSAKAGGSPAPLPAAACESVYSTWYNFHKDVTASALESELELAASLGMKTVILDDGWQCDDIERSYKSCGDWQISTRRFPDMAAHVRRAHELGLKYMVWFSMPFVGGDTDAYRRLRGKFLRKVPDLQAWVIDPRFPECRAYLRDVYLRCLRDWDIDGFKLDFVDAFGLEGESDPMAVDGLAGRDTPSIPEAVECLLREATAALNAEKPDLLYEFRQAYVGPVIRRYGNMVRVGDCPGSLVRNRVHIANLRLLCDGSAVHSDMLRWHPDETPERAQRFILNSLFGTIQYSVMLREAKPEMRAMIAKWIRFTAEHRETLLRGVFRPHFPHLNYPVIEAESASERIVVVYDPAVKFDLGRVDKPTYVIDGVTGSIASTSADAGR